MRSVGLDACFDEVELNGCVHRVCVGFPLCTKNAAERGGAVLVDEELVEQSSKVECACSYGSIKDDGSALRKSSNRVVTNVTKNKRHSHVLRARANETISAISWVCASGGEESHWGSGAAKLPPGTSLRQHCEERKKDHYNNSPHFVNNQRRESGPKILPRL